MIMIKPKFIFKPKKKVHIYIYYFSDIFYSKIFWKQSKNYNKFITRFKIETKPKIKAKIKASLSNLLEFIDLNCKNLITKLLTFFSGNTIGYKTDKTILSRAIKKILNINNKKQITW